MEDNVLIVNQNYFKSLNNDKIVLINNEIDNLRLNIISYNQIIDNSEKDIVSKQEEKAKLEASNLAIDETIKILETT